MLSLAALFPLLLAGSCADGGADRSPDDVLSLLQLPHSHKPQFAPLDPASQQARLQAALPLAWIHVPKCGSSFANFLTDLPGVCPGVPPETVLSVEHGGVDFLRIFKDIYLVDSAGGACLTNIFRWANHFGVGSSADWLEHYKGHAMIMLRQPEQRLVSAYHYLHHSWPMLTPPKNELEFAQVVQGCVVRILTRSGDTPVDSCGGRDGGLPSAEEVQLAVQRVQTDFAFVGLTDQWALSMCLGHKMFGGPCQLSDFVDSRITRGPEGYTEVRMEPEPWNVSCLHGFRDPYDGAVYAAAQEVFAQAQQLYDVSLESCQPCFEEAGVRVS